jgi:hypothetical protein
VGEVACRCRYNVARPAPSTEATSVNGVLALTIRCTAQTFAVVITVGRPPVLPRAQTEANLVRESTYTGFAVARARGRRGGRPTVVTPTHLAEAHRLRESGSGLTEIAKALAIGRTTVRRALNSTSVPDPDPEPDPDTQTTDRP